MQRNCGVGWEMHETTWPDCRAAAASKLGRHSDAVSDADKAVESDPDFAKAYLRRATAHRSLKDFEAAVRDFEKVTSLLRVWTQPTSF